ncbi:MAG TPA: A/G-specific adenine glycosylase [Rhodospirillaceae bacterium]|jgi:A/G-specific adenine glycosylase|nr:A/G-specific adenine glycosylase [Rhodospirillales bacterium]HIJ44500.1 A/G-specific adenine glycosylase [Rhodospirillaceae bacterium]HIJ44741.1 A/G-specific adenine glycosylase [Rhodospirillaceae bacterium]HIJ93425.1 A/G-specific adenine glycosylase [Rhodospirillaceae bacterium]HJP53652.1 A/G-specific adenine glycosylase [Rhodospirillales bacterium]
MAGMEQPRLHASLLSWYDGNARRLPWRALAGETPDPYHVWLSEVMLQQTTVNAVVPYFNRFIGRWPTVADLARANQDQVLHAWQGLGYYARARNLLKCARLVAGDMGGGFPGDADELEKLPGIGPYTAAAIAAIAYGQRRAPVDGNLTRVLARLYAITDPLPGARRRIATLAEALMPTERPGDFAQGLMDLGAALCRPRRPACEACPWREFCAAKRAENPQSYPRRQTKGAKPIRRGIVFWAVRQDGAVLLRRRPETGLLGGMMEFSSTGWRQTAWTLEEARRMAPVAASWRRLPGVVHHTFTHFHLRLAVIRGRTTDSSPADGFWSAVEKLPDHALPTVMKKVARHATSYPEAGKKAIRRKKSGP